jgi:hypothetical protein
VNVNYRPFFNTLISVLLIGSTLAGCGPAPEAPAVENPATSEVSQPVSTPTVKPTASVKATSKLPTPAKSTQAGTWLVMLYQNGDDEVLEEDTFFDLNEAEIVGSTDRVKIVSQIDRYDGGFDGDGDWTTAKRFLVTKDADLNAIHSKEIKDLGEVNSGDPKTLIDFATWAIKTYPSDHYVLIMGDHGSGWDGGWYDDDPVEGSSFRMQDIDDALGKIIAKTDIGAFELVGFDACLMGQLEVMSAIAPHARYAVASEETEPAIGWAYSSFLKTLNQNPDMTGKELGKAIVDSYIDQDFRITNDDARLVYAEGDYSAKSVATDLKVDTTLSAIDLGAMQALNAALNDLILALAKVDQKAVSKARTYAQSYTTVFDNKTPPYIDLGNFVNLLQKNISDPSLDKAAAQVQVALKNAVVAETHGKDRPGSNGLAFYFPNSSLYKTTFGKSSTYQYSAYVGRFAKASLWDDYLTFHYTKKAFKASAADLSVLKPAASATSNFTQAVTDAAPAAGAAIAAPAEGNIKIKPIKVSANKIGPDGSIKMTTEVTGPNVAYIYYYVSYYDQESQSYLTADMGFISADNTKEIEGMYYPDWGNKPVIPIEYTWEPTLYYMSDGKEANDQFAFFEPETYGVDDSSNTYTVRGTYTFVKSGSQVDAVIRFNGDGVMQNVFSFKGEGSGGAPREITPQKGDTFTITEEWLEFDKNPDGEFVDYDGGTMTFKKKGFEMVPYYAYTGDYIIGILVEDLNGNTTEEFVEVTVTE